MIDVSKMVDPQKMVELCIEIIETFNPLRITAATQVEDFAKKKKLSEGVKSFVQEVFYASERYAKMIKTVLDGLYEKHASSVARTDFFMFHVYTVLAMTKLKELGIDSFRKFVMVQAPHNMHTFIKFIWDPVNMTGWFEDQLSRIYDITYVRQTIIGTLLHHQSGINSILAELDAKLKAGHDDSSTPATEREKQVTVPVPFNLSESAPKLVRPRTPIYKTDYKAKPPPETIYATSLEQINREKAERKQEIAAEVVAKHKDFKAKKLHVLDRPTNLEQLVAEKEEEIRQLQVPFKATAVKIDLKQPSQVRRTAAQILRDEARYRIKAEEEAKEMLRFEQELRDNSELEKYRHTMEAKDAAEETKLIEDRRKDMEESAQRAKEASLKLLNENKENAVIMKAEMDILLEKREREHEKAIEKKKELIAEVEAQKENIAIATAKVYEEKKIEAERAIKEREKRARKQKKLEEIEMEKRKELIREIKAMEKLANERGKRPKDFDPSTSSGMGLLEEMSLVELRERLSLVQLRDAEERSRRNAKILVEKRDRADALDAMVRNHEKMRSEARMIGEKERVSRKTNIAITISEEYEKKEKAMAEWVVLDNDKKADKRARALALAKELKAKKVAENFELASKGGRVDAGEAKAAAREEAIARDIEKGARRQEKDREKELAKARDIANHILHKETKRRERNRNLEVRARDKINRERDRNHDALQKEVALIQQVTSDLTKIKTTEIKRQIDQHNEKFKVTHPYATRIESKMKAQRSRKNRAEERRAKSAESGGRMHTGSTSRISSLDLIAISQNRPSSQEFVMTDREDYMKIETRANSRNSDADRARSSRSQNNVHFEDAV